jgi:hypothetical protein
MGDPRENPVAEAFSGRIFAVGFGEWNQMGNDPSQRQPAVNWNAVRRTRSRRKKGSRC